MPDEPLLRVRNLSRAPILKNVGLELDRGRMLGLVGPSGSGKSTLARCIARQDHPTGGEIWIEGRASWDIAEVQLIPQEAAASLNPRFTAAEAIAEPLAIRRRGSRQSRLESAVDWMQVVGLPIDAAGKRAHDFSGGERQRIAIARALAAEPGLLILDESFSGLDFAVQTQITNLLGDLRKRLHLTCLLISHDVTLVARLADRIAVMDDGELVEERATADLLSQPRHPRTRELLAASLALAGSAPA